MGMSASYFIEVNMIALECRLAGLSVLMKWTKECAIHPLYRLAGCAICEFISSF